MARRESPTDLSRGWCGRVDSGPLEQNLTWGKIDRIPDAPWVGIEEELSSHTFTVRTSTAELMCGVAKFAAALDQGRRGSFISLHSSRGSTATHSSIYHVAKQQPSLVTVCRLFRDHFTELGAT